LATTAELEDEPPDVGDRVGELGVLGNGGSGDTFGVGTWTCGPPSPLNDCWGRQSGAVALAVEHAARNAHANTHAADRLRGRRMPTSLHKDPVVAGACAPREPQYG
jgi:hypothetical protein